MTQLPKILCRILLKAYRLAPAGIVTDIYPADENEAGKIDLIHDKERGEISIYARDHHTIVTQGPFELKQGGYGIAVRNPVYLKDENGQEYFLGIYHCYPSCSGYFFQMQQVHFQSLDMNIVFQKRIILGAILIKLFISQIVN